MLYAEDRGLLPVNDARYDDYGLRKRVRDDIARRMADEDAFSTRRLRTTGLPTICRSLFRIIDEGRRFHWLATLQRRIVCAGNSPVTGRTVRLSDADVAPIILRFESRREMRREYGAFVNYRDMSVQQLGSIYERLLEREPVRDDDGKDCLCVPNSYARKDSGSFYTLLRSLSI